MSTIRFLNLDLSNEKYQWTNLLEGDVNFKQVRLALDEIGYDGFLTPELRGGDEAYLTDNYFRHSHDTSREG